MTRPTCSRRKHGGEPCKGPAVRGSNPLACRMHLGKKPQAVIAEYEARRLFAQVFEPEPVNNPLAAYAEFTGRVMAWMNLVEKLLDELRSPRYSNEHGEQIRGEVQLFERAMDRCNTVLAAYARLNIDERLARVTEAQKQMVILAIDAALTAAGVTGTHAVEAKAVAARHLRVVA